MNEEEFIKELFNGTKITYSIEGIEEAVLNNIKLREVYKKKQKTFDFVGKVGFSISLLLSLFYILNIKNADPILIFLGSPFILILLMLPIETLFNNKLNKPSYE